MGSERVDLMAQCPECGSKKSTSQMRLSPSDNMDPKYPWSAVLKVIVCADCKSKVPAHLWEMWDKQTVASAKAEWKKKFKPQTNEESVPLRPREEKAPEGPFLIDLTGKLHNEGDTSLPFNIDLALRRPESVFGRDGDVEFPFDSSMEPQHFAIVQEDDEKCILHNLASGRNTFVNGMGLQEGAVRELQELDSIWFGGQSLLFTSVLELNLERLDRMVVLQNFQTKKIAETWNYKETLSRYAGKLPENLPPEVALVEFLSSVNSYMSVEVRYELKGSPDETHLHTAATLSRLEKKAVHFLKGSQFLEMLRVSNLGMSLSRKSKMEVCFHRLRGIAHGGLKMPKQARLDFLAALMLDVTDAVTLANYITACIDTEDSAAALDGIRRFYSALDGSAKGMVLDSILEAVKCKILLLEDLPEDLVLSLRAKLRQHSC